jgi:putative oxidoreductase
MSDSDAAYLVARILTCGIWVAAGVYKATHVESTVQQMTRLGVPFAQGVLPFVLVLELLGSLCLIANFYVWAVASAWLIYLVPASYLHHLRAMVREDAIDYAQYVLFWKNISIAGGLVLLILLDRSRPFWLFATT